jgi:hypothetical protein
VTEYERLIRLHIVPGLGALGVEDVIRADVARWHSSFKKNRVAGSPDLKAHLANLRSLSEARAAYLDAIAFLGRQKALNAKAAA